MSAYTVRKCRCPECRSAYRVYQGKWELDRMHGRPRRVPADRVKTHIGLLRDGGMSFQDIATAAGYPYPHSVRVLLERPTVSVKTEARILGITIDAPFRGRVAGFRVARRLQALMVRGWTLAEMARRTGLYVETLAGHARGERKYARPEVAGPVFALYEQLQDLDGGSAAAKTIARKRRYVAPAAWENIDRDSKPYRPA